MKLLKEICEQDIGGVTDLSIKLKPRKAVRAILSREDGKIALLYVGKGNYHKLPGGGIEPLEDKDIALHREIEEEVGCSNNKGQEIGVIIEYRQEYEQVQISYCYESTTDQKTFSPNFTEMELNNKFELRRYTLDGAICAIQNDNPETYEGKYIQIRDLEFLQSYITSRSSKHCIIVHGCPSDDTDSTYNKHWMPWTKSQLESKGYKVDTPLMPKPWLPVYKDYKKIFEQYEVTENTILVGHSCGCAFLVRWLGETNQKIKKLILVAPWKVNDEGDKYREAFYGYEIDPTLKERIGEIILFTADNEDPDGKDSLKMYHEALGGKIINNPTYGHYTLNDMGSESFEQLIETIIDFEQ